ncbi:Pr6Pr family membrane protein [Streptomyces sp. ODS28]|uniref:Pr6Pr family membrane protein n=1 Tax=Streptomyces sp. ODS28 TaxID=3136688 RepID=UPI0031EDBB66
MSGPTVEPVRKRTAYEGAARLWHGALLAVVLAALLTQVVLVVQGGEDVNSGSTGPHTGAGARLVQMFSYFTVQSNVLVALSCADLLLFPGRDGPLRRVLRADALIGIVITGLVFALVLAPDIEVSGIGLWVTSGFHYVAPPAALLGWLLFGPRGRMDAATLVRAFVWPLAWLAYTLLHGAVTGWYPYPFLDVAARGYATALTNTSLVLVFAIALALLFRWVDRFLPGAYGVRCERTPQGG